MKYVLRNGTSTLSLALVTALIVTGSLATYYYVQYISVQRIFEETLASLDKISYKVNILINYGNGTRQWSNATRIPIGWNAFNATRAVAILDASYSPEFNAHFINAINRVGLVKDEQHKSWFWFLWLWDTSSREWKLSGVGADLLLLGEGQTVAWVYEDASPFPNLQKPT